MQPWKDQSIESATAANSHLTSYGYTNSDNGVFGISVFPRIPFDVEEKINGITVRKTRFNRSMPNGDPNMISVADASYASSTNGVPVNLITQTITTSFRFSAPQFLANRIASVVYPDGRKDSYVYEKGNYIANVNPALSQFTPDPNGLAERQTLVHGTTAAPDGVGFKTTKDVTVRDQYGNQVLQEIYAYNGTDYERIGWSLMDYDGRGQVVMSRNHKGEMTTAVWTGEQRTSEIDANGIEIVYEYDSLNRVKKQTKKGIAAGGGFPAQADIITDFEYDAEGRQKKETIGGVVVSQRAYDRAGRLASEIDQAGLSTNYSYTNGGRTQTIARSGGATEISDKYIDGQSKNVTGSAVVARYFDYGVNGDGTRYTQEFVGSAGLSSPRWTKTTSDWIDRAITIEKPSFTGNNAVEGSVYNTLGQLQKQTTTANTTKLIADKLYETTITDRALP
jgi:YD repeat-containing protein